MFPSTPPTTFQAAGIEPAPPVWKTGTLPLRQAWTQHASLFGCQRYSKRNTTGVAVLDPQNNSKYCFSPTRTAAPQANARPPANLVCPRFRGQGWWQAVRELNPARAVLETTLVPDHGLHGARRAAFCGCLVAVIRQHPASIFVGRAPVRCRKDKQKARESTLDARA